MDTLSSPGSITSSTATAPASASKQPTYTTAGTLYNPESSQPLQPPTRRGRSLKGTAGNGHTGLSFLPKSVLASLPLKVNSGPVQPVQQYTPLQQNYDRAVSPVNEMDHVGDNMTAEQPRMRSGNTPASPAGACLGTDLVKQMDGYSTDGSDDEYDLRSDPLIMMPVKSLHNLASYPNPNQKRAQKALSRGTKAHLNGLSEASRNRISSNVSAQELDGSGGNPTEPSKTENPFKERALSPSMLTPEPLKLHRRAPTWRPFVPRDDYPMRPTAQFVNENYSDAIASGSYGGSSSASMTLASGPGAPRPLTAGPPGQRQYRPSTFESTFKALKTERKGRTYDNEEDAYSATRQPLVPADIDDPYTALPTFRIDYSETSETRPATQPGLGQAGFGKKTSGSQASRHAEDSFFSWTRAFTYNRDTLVPGSGSNLEPDRARRAVLPWAMGGQYIAGTDRLTGEAIAARVKRINRAWYAGAGLMERPQVEVIKAVCGGKTETTFGAIGEGRPNKIGGQYCSIAVEEANKISVSEHARPLMKLAFASVLRYVEEEALRKAQQSEKPARWPLEQPGKDAGDYLGNLDFEIYQSLDS
ncbi:hypothetical protein G7046_g7014 [Stylonectria norvegica]|nr:hypothetical protein G7046_g7014 [Stylonectria norvegica]